MGSSERHFVHDKIVRQRRENAQREKESHVPRRKRGPQDSPGQIRYGENAETIYDKGGGEMQYEQE